MTRTNNRALANTPHNYVSVLDIGIVPDDISEAASNTSKLEAFMATEPSGSTIFFPIGTFHFTPITMVDSWCFTGVPNKRNTAGSELRFDNLTANDKAITLAYNNRFENIAIIGPFRNGNSYDLDNPIIGYYGGEYGNGIAPTSDGAWCQWDNCWVYGFNIGMYISKWVTHINRCLFQNNVISIQTSGATNDCHITRNTIISYTTSGYIGIYLTGNSNLVNITGNLIEPCHKGIYFEPNSNCIANITGNYLELTNNYFIHSTTGNVVTIRDNFITDYGADNGTSRIGILVLGGIATIEGNTIHGYRNSDGKFGLSYGIQVSALTGNDSVYLGVNNIGAQNQQVKISSDYDTVTRITTPFMVTLTGKADNTDSARITYNPPYFGADAPYRYNTFAIFNSLKAETEGNSTGGGNLIKGFKLTGSGGYNQVTVDANSSIPSGSYPLDYTFPENGFTSGANLQLWNTPVIFTVGTGTQTTHVTLTFYIVKSTTYIGNGDNDNL